MDHPRPQSNLPVFAQFSSENLILGAGVAIFHVASGRVVICSAEDRYGRKYYFLPKGRRDAGEESGRGAEREGYEEVRARPIFIDMLPSATLDLC
jgi:ADP-ribose pyrophosphatase YjhB (NUDIX family)